MPLFKVLASIKAPTFLENLIVLPDSSILATSFSTYELFLVPSPSSPLAQGKAVLLHTFANPTLGIAYYPPTPSSSETDAAAGEVLISTTKPSHPGASVVYRLDLAANPSLLAQGRLDAAPAPLVTLPAAASADGAVPAADTLNGSCPLFISPPAAADGMRALALADCVAGVVWRVELPSLAVEPLLVHETLRPVRDGVRDAWGGVNGVRYDAESGFLFYTSSGQQLLCRVKLDKATLKVAQGAQVEVLKKLSAVPDDLALDVDANAEGSVYLAGHLVNKIIKVSVGGTEEETVASAESANDAGFENGLINPTSLYWKPGMKGKVLIETANGGMTVPLGGKVHDATVYEITL